MDVGSAHEGARLLHAAERRYMPTPAQAYWPTVVHGLRVDSACAAANPVAAYRAALAILRDRMELCAAARWLYARSLRHHLPGFAPYDPQYAVVLRSGRRARCDLRHRHRVPHI